DFSLDLYAYYMAASQGLRVERFPVRFGERAHGVSHWNVNWKAKAKFVKRTAAYSFRLRRELKGLR
ncbi:MAG: glycosyltransferase family 2 protein, partial [Bryobacteraceae bacterium]